MSTAYKAAGVDIEAGYDAVKRILPHAKRTYNGGVVDGIGGFGSMYLPDLSGMTKPVLVSGTDSAGTKLRLAILMDDCSTIGIDCVAMCVNDVICCGAQPLYFLDYFVSSHTRPQLVEQVIAGVAEGCVQSGCALIGGETAEMPGFYAGNDFDLAGFAVGVVDYDKALRTDMVKAGDVLIGLASTGIHSNGYSLVRKVFGIGDDNAAVLREPLYDGKTVGEVLLIPTQLYAKAIAAVIGACEVHGVANITGGGFVENIPRMMNKGLSPRIDTSKIVPLPIFEILERRGNLQRAEMYNIFNMGVGMVVAVPPSSVDAALAALRPHVGATVIGDVVASDTIEIL